MNPLYYFNECVTYYYNTYPINIYTYIKMLSLIKMICLIIYEYAIDPTIQQK